MAIKSSTLLQSSTALSVSSCPNARDREEAPRMPIGEVCRELRGQNKRRNGPEWVSRCITYGGRVVAICPTDPVGDRIRKKIMSDEYRIGDQCPNCGSQRPDRHYIAPPVFEMGRSEPFDYRPGKWVVSCRSCPWRLEIVQIPQSPVTPSPTKTG